MKCPKCGGTMIHKVKLIMDKRRKIHEVCNNLVCACCGYIEPEFSKGGTKMNEWDEFCNLRANNPSKAGWHTLVALLAGGLLLASAVYFGAIWYIGG